MVLLELFPLADNWENIGLFLDVPDGVLLSIKHSHPSDIMRMHEVLISWLKQMNPIWKKLMDAVEPIDPYIAHRISMIPNSISVSKTIS